MFNTNLDRGYFYLLSLYEAKKELKHVDVYIQWTPKKFQAHFVRSQQPMFFFYYIFCEYHQYKQ